MWRNLILSGILCGFVFLFIAKPIQADTYYVNSVSGSDTNVGSAASPWQTLSHGIGQIQASDTLYLTGLFVYGVDYSDTLSIPVGLSGTTASPTTIAVWPDQSASLDVLTMQTVLQVYASNLVISGLIFKAGEIDSTGATAITLENGVSNVTIQNCTFNYSDGSSGITTMGNNDQITIQNNSVSGMAFTGFNLIGVTNSTVTGNSATNNLGGYYGIINLDNVQNVIVTKNYLYDNDEAVAGIQIDNNSNNVLISNNIFTDNFSYAYGVFNQGGSDINVINNTFHANYGGVGDTGDAGNDTTIKNNIFTGNVRALYYATGTPLIADYNLFYNNAVGYVGSDEYYTLANWQNKTNQDRNSFDDDPQFDTTGYGASSFALTADSIAIDHGTGVVEIVDDYEDNARPVSAYYDIGAYEYGVDFTPTQVKKVQVPKQHLQVTQKKIKWKKVTSANSYIVKLMNAKNKKIRAIKKITTNNYTRPVAI
ncbi:MAG: hypothetical protein ACD_43C00267G0001 [uncultured bacterium]|nr:MAG: hypothetical protein ACD_43C00267G0001 [uncultured bacterium]